MSERGLPTVDGAPACPFVAFETDRDERATSPDHRHRCYAETKPAPRALAHQEAYCLASSFPVCPTFQDWARREAARARTASGPPVPGPDETRARSAGAGGAAGSALTGAAGGAAAGLAAAGSAGASGIEAPGFLAGRSRPAGGGLAGSTADRIAGSGDDSDAPAGETGTGSTPEPAGVDQELAGPPNMAPAGRPGDPRPSVAAAGFGATSRGLEDDFGDDSWAAPDAMPAGAPEEPPVERGRAGFGIGGDRRPKVGDTRPRRSEVVAPALDRPRRRDASPTLQTRLRSTSVPRIAVFALALVIAAVALFFLPALLGVGRPNDPVGDLGSPGSTPSANPSSSAIASMSPAPPTPTIYVVKAGDTLSGIATEHGLTLAELIAANSESIVDPDNLQIGDELIIPTPGASGAPGASPGGSPAASADASVAP